VVWFFSIRAWKVREKTPRSTEVGAKAQLISRNAELNVLEPMNGRKRKKYVD
jgi:hypothetical protein